MSTALFFFSSPPHHSNPPHFSCNSNPSHPLFTNADTSISLFKTHFSKTHIHSSKPLRVLPFKTNQNPSTNNENNTNSENPNFSFPSDPPSVKMPTAPWMKGPLLIPSDEVLNLSRIRKQKKKFSREESNDGSSKSENDWSLTQKIRGGRGKQAMRKIVDGITKLKELNGSEKLAAEEVEEFEFRVPIEGVLREGESKLDVRMPWVTKEKIVFRRMKKEIVATEAEKILPELVLKRLKSDAVKLTKWVKVKKAGVTQAVVDEIKMIWKRNELAMVKFDMPLCRNMDRAHEIIEFKTGGLVVWRKKETLVVYRGFPYKSPSNDFAKLHLGPDTDAQSSPSKIVLRNSKDVSAEYLINKVARNEDLSGKNREHNSLSIGVEENVGLQSVQGTLYQREADRLLDGLGPRFIDWWWPKPLPVDADLLPEVVPGFMPPFRLCLPRVRSQLADDELTYLRKLARPLPTHFALGRNTKLQGLASAIMKLWEKSPIVKIAVKWGVPNTNNEQMAWELKQLTGGVLILRNKFFIIFYRGKDFIPPNVANLIVNRETELRRCQLEEESARCKAIESFHVPNETVANVSTIGTFSEFRDIQTKYGLLKNGHGVIDVEIEAEREKLENELRRHKRKLSILKGKIEISAKELAKLNSRWNPAEQAVDHEMITEEEKQCFRKIGLKMDNTLELGRRGIFDGVIESMHQHWKHREVVKVITMQRAFSQVIDTATRLVTESSGILVAIEKLQKGHAIILYRGKNYKRPLKIPAGNLLTKREALQRSLAMQRIGSLKFFAYQRQRIISNLEQKLRDLQKRDEKLTPRDS